MAKSVIRRRSSDEQNMGIDLTPMLDVVFIMLIFFIVTASFIKEAGIEVDRPEATTAFKRDKVSILIAVSAENEIWINQQRVDERSVKAAIERLRAENPKGSVVIQADAKASTKTVTVVMDAARDLGVADVSIATEQGS